MASPPIIGIPLQLSSAVKENNNNVKKYGYLKKQKHGHKRFFVLKEQGEGCPSRLEYYESEKKWKNKSVPKRVICLDSCLNINKRADAKNKYLIALYTKDEYFAVVAENELEQESWYEALTDLMNEGKVSEGNCLSSGSLSGAEDINYGLITPASAVYKEVWQVNLKPKGLGQSKNLMGVYRLCLSSRSISFVKLNSEVPSVSLQLMNIRRCGHSDNFFFIEVGRSASTGPGELWMQADDSVVAQNIHETILEAMKAMKELSEFRPRSKSQSSGSIPISVPSRRHLNNLPPSQTGLQRRSRTDSMAATSPANKFTSCRVRTASEGDGTMARPMSVTGSPSAVRTHLSRSNTVITRHSRVMHNISLQHNRSVSMPVPYSPPSAMSPVSLSSSSGHGSTLDAIQRLSSGSASISGSPSDASFMSFDEYGSSPGDIRHFNGNGNNTPESTAETPPVQEGRNLYGYMAMEKASIQCNKYALRAPREECLESDKGCRKRTYSLTTPSKQKTTPQVSSTSLDEYTLMRATTTGSSRHACCTISPKSPYNPYPEDYVDITVGSQKNSNSDLHDDGYMPMMPGVTPTFPPTPANDYMPMNLTSVSAPKQIINPRIHSQAKGNICKANASCGSSSPDESGYMKMWCASKLSGESSEGRLPNGDYINISPQINHCASLTPPDYFFNPGNSEPIKSNYSFNSLPRSYKTCSQKNGDSQYVLMNSPGQRIIEEPIDNCKSPDCLVSCLSAISPIRHTKTDGGVHRSKAARPTRLSLDVCRTLPSMNEHPLPPEPQSPGEYINIDFGESTRYSPPVSTESPASSLGSVNGQRQSPLSDYINIDLCLQSPKSGILPHGSLDAVSPLSCTGKNQTDSLYTKVPSVSACISNQTEEDYTEMTFGLPTTPPQPISQKSEPVQVTSPTSGVKRLTLIDQIPDIEAFKLSSPPPDPNRGAKVIRADPQGRRRHSSETFSSTTTVTPVSPSFAHDPKRHNSASVENVSLRKNEGLEEGYGSPMSRETSAGFQNGLNYIALDLMDETIGCCDQIARSRLRHSLKGCISEVDSSAYSTLDFLSQNLQEALIVKE
ncbi:insulin receptor substrate 2 [Protopterus annectens]|uniref:insulin receptor substrate 2 n=1 Tax=Protopterus annectens TaxID=7888 RepID=UPI001CFB9F72|nr:insulin receptor substrate 2 [Protopterus annectens]XP_043927261.1 insulin receptor substrate 2 [Protopterus annectens]XP_043927262.1 insulin receptor substrate 2 [Protopterus annectens]